MGTNGKFSLNLGALFQNMKPWQAGIMIIIILVAAGWASEHGANISVSVSIEARVQTIENRMDIPVNSTMSAFQKSNTYLVIQHSAGACLMNQSGYLTEFLANESQIIMDGFGNVSSTGGSVHVQTGSYTASVTVLNNVRFIIDEGATGITWTVDSGATCLIDDFNSGVFAYYQVGLPYSVFNYSSGTLLVATVNSTTVNLNNLVWNGLNRTDTIANPWQASSYVIRIDSGTVKAKNTTSGQVEIQDANASYVFNKASTNLGMLGGIIDVRAGTYNFTNPIILKQYIQLEGEGQSVTTLRLADNANCNLFEYKGSTGNVFAEIGYMTLTGNNGMNTQGSGIYIEPTGGGTFWDLSLKDVFITYFAQYGIYTSQFWGYDFFHVISEYNTLDGIRITGGSSGHIISSKFMSNGQNGLNATGSGYLDFTDCDFRQNGYHGAWLNATAYSFMSCHIIGNSIATNDTWLGIFLYGNAASYTRIISCEFNGKSGTNVEHRAIGIAASGVDGTIVEDNTFYGYGAAAIVNYGTNSMIHYNHGFVTENTILNVANTTATTFVFNHGCASTVNSVQCSFNLTVAYTWTWTSTTTQVTVTVTPGSGVTLPAVMGILSADVKYLP